MCLWGCFNLAYTVSGMWLVKLQKTRLWTNVEPTWHILTDKLVGENVVCTLHIYLYAVEGLRPPPVRCLYSHHPYPRRRWHLDHLLQTQTNHVDKQWEPTLNSFIWSPPPPPPTSTSHETPDYRRGNVWGRCPVVNLTSQSQRPSQICTDRNLTR